MNTAAPPNLCTVHSLEMLEYCVKESELLTAEHKRAFFVFGAPRISPCVGLFQNGYEVLRESDSGAAAHPLLPASSHDLHKHAVGKAMLSGALFTSAIH